MAIGDNLRLARAQTAEATIQNIKSQEALADRLAKIGVAGRREATIQQTAEAKQARFNRIGEIQFALQSRFGGDVDAFTRAEPELAQEGFALNAINPRRVTEERAVAPEKAIRDRLIAEINERTDIDDAQKAIEISKIGKEPKDPRLTDIDFSLGRAAQDIFDPEDQAQALRTFKQLGFQGIAEQAFLELNEVAETAGMIQEDALDAFEIFTDAYFGGIQDGFIPETVAGGLVTTAVDSVRAKFAAEGLEVTKEQLIQIALFVLEKIDESGKR